MAETATERIKRLSQLTIREDPESRIQRLAALTQTQGIEITEGLPPANIPEQPAQPQQQQGPIVQFPPDAIHANSPAFQQVLGKAQAGGLDVLSDEEKSRVQAAGNAYPEQMGGFLREVIEREEVGRSSPEVQGLSERLSQYKELSSGPTDVAGTLQAGAKMGADLLSEIGQFLAGPAKLAGDNTPFPISPFRDLESNPPTAREIRLDREFQQMNKAEKALHVSAKTTAGAVKGVVEFTTQTMDQILNPEKHGTTSGQALEDVGVGLVDMIVQAPDQMAFLLDQTLGKNNPFSKLSEAVGTVVQGGKLITGANRQKLYEEAVNALHEAPESLPFAIAMVRHGVSKSRAPKRLTFAEEVAEATKQDKVRVGLEDKLKKAEETIETQKKAKAEADAVRKTKQEAKPVVPETADPAIPRIEALKPGELRSEALSLQGKGGFSASDIAKMTDKEAQFIVSGGRIGIEPGTIKAKEAPSGVQERPTEKGPEKQPEVQKPAPKSEKEAPAKPEAVKTEIREDGRPRPEVQKDLDRATTELEQVKKTVSELAEAEAGLIEAGAKANDPQLTGVRSFKASEQKRLSDLEIERGSLSEEIKTAPEAKIGFEEAEKRQKPVKAPEITPESVAKDLDITFNGMQERAKKPPIALFTDKKTGTTFPIEDLSKAKGELAKRREKFEKPAKEKAPDTQDIDTGFDSADIGRKLGHARADVKVAEQALALKEITSEQRGKAQADLVTAEAKVAELQPQFEAAKKKITEEATTGLRDANIADTGLKTIATKDIALDEGRFQGRKLDTPEKQKQFDDRVDAIVAEFDPAEARITVWKDPKTGKFVLLQGHHTLGAIKKLGRGETNVRIFKGTEAQALAEARIKGNRRTQAETITEDVSAYNLAKDQGMGKAELERTFGKDRVNRLESLSNLDPNGKFMRSVEETALGEHPHISRWTRNVGDLRKKFPELLDRHEQQIFDQLYPTDKATGLFDKLTKDELFNMIEKQVTDITWDSNFPVKLKRDFRPQTGSRTSPNESIKQAQVRIDEIDGLIRKAKTPGEQLALKDEKAALINDLNIANEAQGGLFDIMETPGEAIKGTGEAGTTLGFMGMNPEVAAALGVNLKKAGKGVAEATAELSAAIIRLEGRVALPNSKDVFRQITRADESWHRREGTALFELRKTDVGKSKRDITGEDIASNIEAGKAPEISAIMQDMLKQAKDVGIPIGDRGANYFPRSLKRDVAQKILDDLSGLTKELESGTFSDQALAKRLEGKGTTQEFVNHLIETGQAKTVKQAIEMLNKKAESEVFQAPSFVEQRVLELPSSAYERDARIVLPQYIRRMSKYIAQVEAWGGRILAEGTEGKTGRRVTFKKLEDQINRIAEKDLDEAILVRKGVDLWSGAYEAKHALTGITRKAVDNWTALQFLTKISLGTASIPNAVQTLISTFPKAGMVRTLTGAAKLTTGGQRAKVYQSGTLNRSLLEATMGTGAGTSLLAKVVDRFPLSEAFTGINRFNSALSASTAEIWIRDLHKIANGSQGSSFGRLLNKMTKGERAKWAQENLNESYGIDYTKALTENQVLEGMYRFATDGQLQRNVLKDPILFNDPRTRPFALFKRFGYRQALESFDVVRSEWSRKNYLPLFRLVAGGTVGGVGVVWAKDMIKEALSGDPQYRKEDYTKIKFYVDNIGAAGAFGVAADMMSSLGEEDLPSAALQFGRDVAFQVTPVPFSDLANAWESSQRIGRDWKKFGSLWGTLEQIGLEEGVQPLGSIPRAIVRRAGTDKQKQDRFEHAKGLERTAILRLYGGKDSDEASRRLQLWNSNYEARYQLGPKDINYDEIVKQLKKDKKSSTRKK